MDGLGERCIAVLRTAGVSPRSFAKVIGVHYTTVYSFMKHGNTVHRLVLSLNAVKDGLDMLEKLVNLGKLPFDKKPSANDEITQLKHLFTQYK